MRFACFFILCLGLHTRPVYAKENIVNIYNWSNYISNDVLKEFTQETGIQSQLYDL